MVDDKREKEIEQIKQLHRLRQSTTHDGEAEAARLAILRKMERSGITWSDVWKKDERGDD